MKATWSAAAQQACTTGNVVCRVVGCARVVYADQVCSDHWKPPAPPASCEHRQRIITCGCCGRHVCEACWGHWKSLACVDCRRRAR